MAIAGSTLIPSTRYRDAYAAIDWLCSVLGFTQKVVYGDGKIVFHAELTHGLGMFMLGSEDNGGLSIQWTLPLSETGRRETIGMYLVVEDCDAVYARVIAVGAEIVQELNSPPHGGKTFTCRDLEGHIWSVGSYDPWAAAPEAAEGTA